MMNGSESGDMDCRGSYFDDGILVLLFLFLVEVQVSFFFTAVQNVLEYLSFQL